MTPRDVDVALLYDGFTFNCLSWLEALGFCELGEGAAFLGDGSRIALDGELPLNPHGGQLSAGRTHGFGFIHEAIVQLRGDGDDAPGVRRPGRGGQHRRRHPRGLPAPDRELAGRAAGVALPRHARHWTEWPSSHWRSTRKRPLSAARSQRPKPR